MISVEDKLASFKKIISDDISTEQEKRLADLERESEKEIRDYNDKIQKEIIKIKEDYEEKARQRKEKFLSKIHKEGEDLFSDIQKEIYMDVQSSLFNKLKADYKGPSGLNFLKNQLLKNKDFFSEEDEILLSENEFSRDQNTVKKLFPHNKITADKRIKIGGAIIVSADRSYQINCSLDYLLENKKDQINNDVSQFLKVDFTE